MSNAILAFRVEMKIKIMYFGTDLHDVTPQKDVDFSQSAFFMTRMYISLKNTRWFKYDRDDLCVTKSQFVPVIFEPPFTSSPRVVLFGVWEYK